LAGGWPSQELMLTSVSNTIARPTRHPPTAATVCEHTPAMAIAGPSTPGFGAGGIGPAFDLSSRTRTKRALSDASTSSSASAGASADGEGDGDGYDGRRGELAPVHPAKFHRADLSNGAGSGQYICCLPPTCHQPSTAMAFESAEEMERHQARYHAFVCRVGVRDRDRNRAHADGGGRPNAGKGTLTPASPGRTESEGEGSGMERDGSAGAEGVAEDAGSTARRSAAEWNGNGTGDADGGGRLPAAFQGRHGWGKERWRECGRVFPDERFLELVSCADR
jgi:hypothetical protein